MAPLVDALGGLGHTGLAISELAESLQFKGSLAPLTMHDCTWAPQRPLLCRPSAEPPAGSAAGVSPRPGQGFPGGSAGKESACNVGDLGSIPELGRSPGEGKSYPLQYSGLENPWIISMGRKEESDMTE